MRRRLIRLLILPAVLAGVAALAAGAFEYVRHTDLPRRWAAEQIAQQTGLNAEIERLQLTWGGRTVIEGLALTPPLEEAPLVELRSLRIAHNGVLGMLLSFSVDLRAIEADGLALHLRQQPAGRWNFQDAIDLLARPNGEDAPAAAALRLPELTVSDISLFVTDADGATDQLGPLSIHGRPEGTSVWAFEADLPRRVRLQGKLVTRDPWPHQLELTVSDPGLEPLVRRWAPNLPEPIELAVRWSGRRDGEGLSGRLRIGRAVVAPWRAHGTIDIAASPAAPLTVQPQGLTIEHTDDSRQRLRFLQGALRWDAGAAAVRIEGLRVRGGGVDARLDGAWSPPRQSGELDASWTGASADPAVAHSGTLHAAYSRPAPDRHHVRANVQSTGRMPAGGWDLSADLTATGPRWQSLQVDLSLPKAQWRPTGQPPIVLDGARASLSTRWPELRLDQLHLPDAGRLEASAHYDVSDRTWRAELTAERWTPPRMGGRSFDLALSASGEADRIRIESLEARSGQATLRGDGGFDPSRESPLEADLTVAWSTYPSGESGPNAAASGPAAASGDTTTDAPEAAADGPRWAAQAQWMGHLSGSLRPPHITADGVLRAERLVVNGRSMHDLRSRLRADATDQNIQLEAEPFDLLGGRCELSGRYDLADRTTALDLTVGRLALDRLAALVNPQIRLAGLFDGRLQLSIPQLDPSRMELSGQWYGEGLTIDPLRIDRAQGRLRTRGRWLRLEPITLRKGQGVAEGAIRFNLRDGRTVHAELRGSQWPLRIEQRDLDLHIVEGRANVDIDVAERQASGGIGATMDVALRQRPLGRWSMDGRLDLRQSRLVLDHIEADAFGGHIGGAATVVFDPWLHSTAELSWSGVELARFEPLLDADPPKAELRGRLNGSLSLAPAQDSRAPEPVRLHVELEPDEATINTVPVGRIVLTAYAGPDRFVLHESQINVAGGKASVWLAASPRPSGWHAHTQATLEALDVNLLNRAFDPDAGPTPGRLDGTLAAFGTIGQWHTIASEGDLRLSESDLANNAIIGSIFNAMRLDLSEPEPSGYGTIDLRLEEGALHIVKLAYFNRGVDIYGDLTIERLAEGGASPISGTVLGTVRPLKNINLPGVRQVDRMLLGMQSSVTTIRVHGTASEPETAIVGLEEVLNSMRRILLGRSSEQQAEESPDAAP